MVRVCITENVLRAGESVSEDVRLHFHEFCIFKLLCMWMQVFLEKVRDRVSGCRDFCHRGVGGVCWKRVGGFYRWSVPSGTAGSCYCAQESHTGRHIEVRTHFLTLRHHWLHPCHSHSCPPFLRHTVIPSSSVSCTTSFLVCHIWRLDSAGKTGKSALESSTEACDNVLLVSYIYISHFSLSFILNADWCLRPAWTVLDANVLTCELLGLHCHCIASQSRWNWTGPPCPCCVSSQLIRARDDKHPWLLQILLTWKWMPIVPSSHRRKKPEFFHKHIKKKQTKKIQMPYSVMLQFVRKTYWTVLRFLSEVLRKIYLQLPTTTLILLHLTPVFE